MSVGEITVTIRAEFICEYDGQIVLAVYMNDSFAGMVIK